MPEIPARLPCRSGEESCLELNAEKDELEKSLIPSLGGFSVISRPLTDFEITASSYSVLPIMDCEGLLNRLGGALQILSSFR